MLLQLSHFPSFIPLCPAHPLPPAFPSLQLMSMGRTCKFFGFYISYTILTSPCLFSTYHLRYLFPVAFPAFSPSQGPTDHPPCGLYFCDSVSVVVVSLVFLVFVFSRFGY